jgi:uncharacterized membrane protein YtjA (UPF0391 family)
LCFEFVAPKSDVGMNANHGVRFQRFALKPVSAMLCTSTARCRRSPEYTLCGTAQYPARYLHTTTLIRSKPMGSLLHYAIVFLVVALVAAAFGFGGVTGTAIEGARLLMWGAIVLFVVSLVAGFIRRV